MQTLYLYEHGHRVPPGEPRPVRPEGPGARILRTGEPVVLATRAEMLDVAGPELAGTALSGVWLPIAMGTRTLGGLKLRNHQREHAFGKAELRLLRTVASSMGVALENARLFDETQRLLKETEARNAELAVINRIQQAVSGQLEFQVIVDAVGDELCRVFDGKDLAIWWFDEARGDIFNLFGSYGGKRGATTYRHPVTEGDFTHRIIHGAESLVAGTWAEQERLGVGVVPGTARSLSIAAVPIVGGQKALGIVAIEDFEREHAFDAATVRLLGTVASSMGMALANARSFEAERQRAAELAVINSVQAGLAAKLDIQEIHELVAEKIQEVFDAQVVALNGYDPATDTAKSWFMVERGQRFQHDPWVLGGRGFNAKALTTRRTVLVNRDMAAAVREVGSQPLPGESAKSGVWVPLLAGSEARGVITLQHLDREDAFSESDVRLLETLAASMSVALENARLFDETQRLLKETEARNAELAVINGVQQGMAGSLDFQGIVELVGEKLRTVFGVGDLGIHVWDEGAQEIVALYAVEHGVRLPVMRRRVEPGDFIHKAIVAEEVFVFASVEEQLREGVPVNDGTDRARSILGAPMLAGEHLLGFVVIENHERDHAFGDADVRLLTTVASSMAMALDNVPPVRRNPGRAAAPDRQR